MWSPTGYVAWYTATARGQGEKVVDAVSVEFPVVDYINGMARIIDRYGELKTVTEFAAELQSSATDGLNWTYTWGVTPLEAS